MNTVQRVVSIKDVTKQFLTLLSISRQNKGTLFFEELLELVSSANLTIDQLASVLMTANAMRKHYNIGLSININYDDMFCHIEKGELRMIDWNQYFDN